MDKISKILIISVLSLAVVLGLGTAQTDTASIDSNISSSTAIDISPNNFSWNATSVGSVDANYRSAELENIGSTNVSSISMDVTIAEPGTFGQPTGGVHGGGNAQATNLRSGNFLMISSDNISFGYVMTPLENRTAPVYIQANGSSFFSTIDFGPYQYYVMVAQRNGSGSSTCSNGSLYLSNTTLEVHNRTQAGNATLSSKTAIQLQSNALSLADGGLGTNSGQNGSWGIASVSFNTPITSGSSVLNQTYCIAIANNCTTGRLWKYNNNVDPYDNNSLCTNDAPFYNDTTTGGGFKPGAMTRLYLTQAVGLGYPNGTYTQSVLTIRATD